MGPWVLVGDMSTALNTTHNSQPFSANVPEFPDYWNEAPQAPTAPAPPLHQPRQAPVVTPPAEVARTGKATPVLMAISDPVLAPEVATVIAATGRGVIDTVDPRDIERLGSKVSVVLADPTTAPALAGVAAGVTKVLIFPEPGPADFELAMTVHADHALVIPAQAPQLLQIIGRTDSPAQRSGGRGLVTCVIGAVGGSGASTLAAALTIAQKDSTLVDAVPLSGGLDLLMGVEDAAGVRFNDVALGSGNIAASDLKNALPHVKSGQAVLTSARLSADTVAPEEIATAVDLLASTGDVVIDCPYYGEEFSAAVAVADHVVIVVPSEIQAVARAKILVDRLKQSRVGCTIVVRHRGWSGLSIQEIESITSATVIAELPTVKKLAKTIELQGIGRGLPSALDKCAKAIIAHVKAGAL